MINKVKSKKSSNLIKDSKKNSKNFNYNKIRSNNTSSLSKNCKNNVKEERAFKYPNYGCLNKSLKISENLYSNNNNSNNKSNTNLDIESINFNNLEYSNININYNNKHKTKKALTNKNKYTNCGYIKNNINNEIKNLHNNNNKEEDIIKPISFRCDTNDNLSFEVKNKFIDNKIRLIDKSNSNILNKKIINNKSDKIESIKELELVNTNCNKLENNINLKSNILEYNSKINHNNLNKNKINSKYKRTLEKSKTIKSDNFKKNNKLNSNHKRSLTEACLNKTEDRTTTNNKKFIINKTNSETKKIQINKIKKKQSLFRSNKSSIYSNGSVKNNKLSSDKGLNYITNFNNKVNQFAYHKDNSICNNNFINKTAKNKHVSLELYNTPSNMTFNINGDVSSNELNIYNKLNYNVNSNYDNNGNVFQNLIDNNSINYNKDIENGISININNDVDNSINSINNNNNIHNNKSIVNIRFNNTSNTDYEILPNKLLVFSSGLHKFNYFDVSNDKNITDDINPVNEEKIPTYNNILFYKAKPVNEYLDIRSIPIDMSITKCNYSNFIKGKYSINSIGIIKSYAANTYNGTVRTYNEDRVAVIVKATNPFNNSSIKKQSSDKNNFWPVCSIFAIYDGHGGSTCSDYLKDNLHLMLIKHPLFVTNTKQAIKESFNNCDSLFLQQNLSKNQHEKSGSCALVLIIVEDNIYIANLGDSRAILSKNKGNQVIQLTNDHKPSNINEKKRILNNGGKIYQ